MAYLFAYFGILLGGFQDSSVYTIEPAVIAAPESLLLDHTEFK